MAMEILKQHVMVKTKFISKTKETIDFEASISTKEDNISLLPGFFKQASQIELITNNKQDCLGST